MTGGRTPVRVAFAQDDSTFRLAEESGADLHWTASAG